MDTTTTISDIRGFVRRRAKLFLVIFSLFMTAAVIVALTLPPVYRSQAVILIEAAQIPNAFIQSTVTSYAEQRLEMITRDILKSEVLWSIIEEFDLYPEYQKNKNISAAVGEMTAAIGIEPISSKAGKSSATVAFILSYEASDPQKAYAVTNRLSNLYLKKETATRERQAASTTAFLESELKSLKQQIEKNEKQISDFKQQHLGELPENAAANLSTLQRLEREAEQTDLRIRALQDRKLYLNSQLAYTEPLKPIQTESGGVASNPQERLKTLRFELIQARTHLSEKHPDVKKLIREIKELEDQIGHPDLAVAKVKQLNALRAELKTLKASKGDRHPDVINLSKQIDELSKEVDSLLNQNTVSDLSKEKPDNPAYINLRTQIVSTDLEIDNLQKDLANTRSMIKDYQTRVESAPTMEREYNDLTIDYKNAKDRYNEVSSKLRQARLGLEMEIQQQGEHFTITDPAYIPKAPFKPNRLAIMFMGFAMATGAGLGAAAFKEGTDHTIKAGKDIAGFRDIELLTIMPYTQTKEEHRYQMHKRMTVAAGCLGFFGFVLVIINWFVLPLNQVFSIVIGRMTF